MKAVYEVTEDIPELGMEPGGLLTVRPDHPENPLIFTRRLAREELVTCSTYRGRLSAIDGGPDLLEDIAAKRLQLVAGGASTREVAR